MMVRKECSLCLIAALVLAQCSVSQGFGFDLQATKEKCFIEEDIDAGVLVVGDYFVSEPRPGNPRMPISIKVKDAKGKVVYERDNLYEGKFAFTTDSEGDVTTCFKNNGPPRYKMPRRIKIKLRHGLEAQDYEKALKQDDISSLGRQLVEVEELTKNIVHDLKLSKNFESEMRDLSELICGRVLFFGFFTLVVLFGAGFTQTKWLENYMRKNKMI